MRFLFRLDLSLHAGAEKKFGILILGTKHGPDLVAVLGMVQPKTLWALNLDFRYVWCSPCFPSGQAAVRLHI
jgi:hypothetical protein